MTIRPSRNETQFLVAVWLLQPGTVVERSGFLQEVRYTDGPSDYEVTSGAGAVAMKETR
jgi:hypothetical protein